MHARDYIFAALGSQGSRELGGTAKAVPLPIQIAAPALIFAREVRDGRSYFG